MCKLQLDNRGLRSNSKREKVVSKALRLKSMRRRKYEDLNILVKTEDKEVCEGSQQLLQLEGQDRQQDVQLDRG